MHACVVLFINYEPLSEKVFYSNISDEMFFQHLSILRIAYSVFIDTFRIVSQKNT